MYEHPTGKLCDCGCGQPVRGQNRYVDVNHYTSQKCALLWEQYATVGNPNECWEWRGRINQFGYGRFGPKLAHRIAYEKTYGPFPAELLVCHHCDNPPCINPAHLFLGTNVDNSRDMVSKGRAPFQSARLKGVDVLEIRRRCASGERQADVGKDFGITRFYVSQIVCRSKWKEPQLRAALAREAEEMGVTTTSAPDGW